MNNECIFCRIGAGELSSATVYEDADSLAFLDIAPVVKGHTLVIPKEHHDPLMDTPGPTLDRLIRIVRAVARAMRDGLEADGINVTQANGVIAGQIIPHVHFHIIPRFDNDAHNWAAPQGQYDSEEERHQTAARLASNLATDTKDANG